jgi:hypothetical protein
MAGGSLSQTLRSKDLRMEKMILVAGSESYGGFQCMRNGTGLCTN